MPHISPAMAWLIGAAALAVVILVLVVLGMVVRGWLGCRQNRADVERCLRVARREAARVERCELNY